MIILTQKNFTKEVLESSKLVLVDFWAEWCFPCKLMLEILKKINETYGNRIKLGKLNIDENPEISFEYGIEAVPSLLFFKNGKLVDKIVGVVSFEILTKRIEENLKK